MVCMPDLNNTRFQIITVVMRIKSCCLVVMVPMLAMLLGNQLIAGHRFHVLQHFDEFVHQPLDQQITALQEESNACGK